MSNRQLYIGIMTGTSADGLDAVLMDFQQQPISIDFHSLNFSAELKNKIHSICQPKASFTFRSLVEIHKGIAQRAIEAILHILTKNHFSAEDIQAIGCHGQTLYHSPEQGISWQFGDLHEIAKATDIKVVGDFRQADVCLDGQGAPLIPLFHRAFYHSANSNRILLNLGGIANLTYIDRNLNCDVIGYDTGPANTLLDRWNKHINGTDFDANGQWAASGKVNHELLQKLLQDNYFNKPHPKSTGREYFHLPWLQSYLDQVERVSENDIQRTLLELTAISITDQLKRFSISPTEIYPFGGGVNNPLLMKRIAELLGSSTLGDTNDLSINPQYMEAACFAWLAKQRLECAQIDATSITGSTKPHLFGVIYQ